MWHVHVEVDNDVDVRFHGSTSSTRGQGTVVWYFAAAYGRATATGKTMYSGSVVESFDEHSIPSRIRCRGQRQCHEQHQ